MKPHAFVAMPFGVKTDREGNEIDFNRVYAELIKPALEAADLEPFRADQEIRAGDIRTDMFQALERVQQRMFPQAITLPSMLTGATDSAQLREKGVHAYGLGPLVTEEDGARVHGNDERVHIAGLGKFVQYLYECVVEVAAAK